MHLRIVFDEKLVKYTQLIGRLFSPSQKVKKLSHPFRLCFELGFGILNPLTKFFWVFMNLPVNRVAAKESIFQGKKCLSKMVLNFSEMDFGFT